MLEIFFIVVEVIALAAIELSRILVLFGVILQRDLRCESFGTPGADEGGVPGVLGPDVVAQVAQRCLLLPLNDSDLMGTAHSRTVDNISGDLYTGSGQQVI